MSLHFYNFLDYMLPYSNMKPTINDATETPIEIINLKFISQLDFF